MQQYYRFIAASPNAGDDDVKNLLGWYMAKNQEDDAYKAELIMKEKVNSTWEYVARGNSQQDVFLLGLSPPADFNGMQVRNNTHKYSYL